ncbi:hypothetical protein [Lacticaseibacillus camelliae]|nr:hypothetical protein [Lacticaseibacillus camelliae]
MIQTKASAVYESIPVMLVASVSVGFTGLIVRRRTWAVARKR